MKYIVFTCMLTMVSGIFIFGQRISAAAPEPCQVWGRVIASRSMLQNGVQIELEGNKSAPRQKANVEDGAFELKATPPGVYRFRVLDGTGAVILEQAVHLKGPHDRVVLHVPVAHSNLVSVKAMSFVEQRKLPKKAVDAFHAGEKAAQNGDWEESLSSFEKASAMAPRFTEAEANVSVECFRMGRLDDAISHAWKAYEADPDLAGTGYNLGSMLIDAKRYQEAEPVLRFLLRTQTQITEVNGLLAASLAGTGRIDEAYEHLKLAVTEFPEQRLLVAPALIYAGRLDLAIMQVRQYMQSAASECERRYLEDWIARATRSQTDIAPAP